MQLRDRVALVTGAGSGIGKASAVLLGKEGAKVAALSRTREELKKTVKEIEDAGGEGLVVVADTSRPAEVEDAVRRVVDRWGRLDIVFANAGVNGVWAPIEELEVDEWRQTVDINLTGTFLTLKYSMPHLKERGGSVIVNASVNGTRVFSNSGATAYASTKAAQVAMTKMLALEVARHRVRVNVICPGAIDTEIDDNTERRDLDGIGVPQEFPEGPHPLAGKPGSSQEVAQLVLFLASDASRHVTGTEIWIDGGESLLGLKG
jgi:NAD(P)-dependent dehydrogenase (short-subunit alcohol dehydrogenase family)